MPTWLTITLGVIGGAGTLATAGCWLLAKFLPREKCAQMLWQVTKKGIDAADVALDVKVGKKSAEEIEETVLGTIFFSLRFVGIMGMAYLKNNDSDGDFKD
jgi:hypothetical protein